MKRFLIFYFLLSPFLSQSQSAISETLPHGELDNWLVREITESFIIGGSVRYIYEVAIGDTIFNNTPYSNIDSPWGTSSVMAKVKGIYKASITVFPEERDGGYCARLETRMEESKVLGLFNIKVIATGTLFLGEMVEPIRNTNNPQSKMITGIPFNKKPKALQYDYSVVTGGRCTQATGFGRQRLLDEIDMAETQIILQHRSEDKDGNIYAKRIGTGWERFNKTEKEWQNGHILKILYGDISSEKIFKPYMDLKNGENAYYTRNSKGKIVPIEECEWGEQNEEVTHLIIQFSSSCGGAYRGNINSRFRIDNIKLLY